MATFYRPATAGDLQSAIDEAGLSAGDFAALVGWPENEIRNMLLGAQSIPHIVALSATLLTIPEALELARINADHFLRVGLALVRT